MSTRSILVMEPCYPRYFSRRWMEPYNHRRALRKKLPFWSTSSPSTMPDPQDRMKPHNNAGKNRRITCEISLMCIIWTTIWYYLDEVLLYVVAFEWIFQAHFGFFPHFRVDIWDCPPAVSGKLLSSQFELPGSSTAYQLCGVGDYEEINSMW